MIMTAPRVYGPCRMCRTTTFSVVDTKEGPDHLCPPCGKLIRETDAVLPARQRRRVRKADPRHELEVAA